MAHMRLKPDRYEEELSPQIRKCLLELHAYLFEWGKSDHIQITFSPVSMLDSPPIIDLVL